jgi:hypothetical protein
VREKETKMGEGMAGGRGGGEQAQIKWGRLRASLITSEWPRSDAHAHGNSFCLYPRAPNSLLSFLFLIIQCHSARSLRYQT